MVNLFLTIHPVSDTIIQDEVVKGEIYNHNGFLFQTDTIDEGTFNTQRYVLNQYGCDSVIYLQLDVTVGIKERKEVLNVFIYPNPAHEYIDIQFTRCDFQTKELLLSDITGKIIKTQNLNHATVRINLSDLAQGMYFLTIKEDNNILKTLKVIKQ